MLPSAPLSGDSATHPRPKHGDRDPVMKRSGERRWWPVLAPIAVIALAVSLLLPASRHQWALSVFRQPSRYTALSFNDASELPNTANRGTPIPISFTIGNQEGRTLTYTYVVSESDQANFFQTMATAARTLEPGRTWTVALDVKPTCGPSPCRIQVSVRGHPERIDFLVILKAAEHKHHTRKSSHRAGRHHARRT